jgi:hypothetical protein
VLLLLPAPAAPVEAGRTIATFSARLRMAVLGPPGCVGLDRRPVAAPTPGLAGEDAPGEDLNWLARGFLLFEKGELGILWLNEGESRPQ